jgi:hypothetical protein
MKRAKFSFLYVHPVDVAHGDIENVGLLHVEEVVVLVGVVEVHLLHVVLHAAEDAGSRCRALRKDVVEAVVHRLVLRMQKIQVCNYTI